MLLYLGCKPVEVVFVGCGGGALRRRAVLEPGNAGDEVRTGTNEIEDAEAFLAFAYQKEAVVNQALVLDDFTDAADGSDGTAVGEDDAEAEVSGKESVH